MLYDVHRCVYITCYIILVQQRRGHYGTRKGRTFVGSNPCQIESQGLQFFQYRLELLRVLRASPSLLNNVCTYSPRRYVAVTIKRFRILNYFWIFYCFFLVVVLSLVVLSFEVLGQIIEITIAKRSWVETQSDL